MINIKRGIVIQNDDPESIGRVKVFFPDLSPSVYSGWRELAKDLQFKFIGLNLNSDLTPIIPTLKQLLPWAEIAIPSMGGGSSGRYNAAKQHGSVSDSPNDFTNVSTPLSNSTGLDEKAGVRFEIDGISDAFTGKNGTLKVNPLSSAYTPSLYSNSAKGSFDIPNVGAHVWAFFENDDPCFPVVFAVSHSQDEWLSIYGSPGNDYPSGFENNSVPDLGKQRIFRHKHVISEKGGVIEIINTDNKESIRLSQAGGSNIALTNEGISQFSAKHTSELTLGDKFATIRGDNLCFTHGNSEITIEKDRTIRIGRWQEASSAIEAWMTNARPLGQIKQLFDIKRANKNDFSASNQIKVGNNAPHPLTVAGSVHRLNLTQTFSSVSGTHSLVGSTYNMGNTMPSVVKSTVQKYSGQLSPSTKGGNFAIENLKTQLSQLNDALAKAFKTAEIAMGEGGSDIVKVTKDKTDVIGAGINDLPAIRCDENGNLRIVGVEITPDGAFPKFSATALIEKVHVDKTPFGNLTQIVGSRYELSIGSGGYQISTTGVMDWLSPMINLTTLETNFIAKKNINFISDSIYLSAPKIAISSPSGSVGIDSNLGVTQNLAVCGAGYFDGGIFTNKITAPAQWEETAPIILFGKIIPGMKIGVTSDGKDVTAVPMEMTVQIYPHTMAYKIPATDFKISSNTMALSAQSLNNNTPATPTAIINGTKTPN